MIRGKDVALSLLVVGTAAAAGYVFRSESRRRQTARSKADLGARIVDEIPDGATVVDASSTRLAEIPGARRVLERAVRDEADDEWVNVTLEHDGAWSIVDAVRSSLPYHDADGGDYNGVYVRYEDRVVVLDAIGWARLEKRLQ